MLKPEILILTRGRDMSMQLTAQALLAAGVKFRFCQTMGDDTKLDHVLPRIIVEAKNIAEKREKVLATQLAGYTQTIMLDDDIKFHKVTDTGTKKATPVDVADLFKLITKQMETNALVGVEQRFMIQMKEKPFNTKLGPLLHLFAINKSLLTGKERFDRVIGHEDIDFVLQVLWNKLPVSMISNYCHDDIGNFERKGGCSIWRTKESCLEQVLVLERLWPHLITHKFDKNGVPRVRCKWAKVRAHRSIK